MTSQPLPPARLLAGAALLGAGLPALVALLLPQRSEVSYAVPVLLVLLLVVVVSAVGGLRVAVPGAVAGVLALNWWFTPPYGSLVVADGDHAVVLAVFVSTALVVAGVTGLAARRSVEARRAQDEASALSSLAGAALSEQTTLTTLLERVRSAFASDGVALLDEGRTVESVGDLTGQVQAAAVAGEGLELQLHGATALGLDRALLTTFAEAAATALEGRRLAQRAAEAAALRAAERTRSALLQAVGHDLRTPLATLRTSTEGLALPGLDDADRHALAETAAEATGRLTALVDNLLDASRLEAGVVTARLETVPLADLVDRALLGLAGVDRVHQDLPEDLPPVRTDLGLTERVLGNLLQNALRYSPAGTVVTVRGRTAAGAVQCDVVDHGPGLPDGVDPFQPFQRFTDRNDTGLGLGLAIAQGFAQTVGGTLVARRTEGGGTTMRLTLPVAS